MRRKLVCILLTIAVVVVYSVPCFATEEFSVADETVAEEVESLISDMQDASADGVISKAEKCEMVISYSEEAIQEYKEIAFDEMNEALDGYEITLSADSEEPVYKEDIITLDCGAQLQIVVSAEPTDEIIVEDDVNEDLGTGLLNNLIPKVYAKETVKYGSAGFGNVKFTSKATLIELGAVWIKLTSKVKASKKGFSITSATGDSNSMGYMDDDDFTCSITDKTAKSVGDKCSSQAKLKYHNQIPIAGGVKLPKKYYYLKQTMEVTSINAKLEKVGYRYTIKTWNKKI